MLPLLDRGDLALADDVDPSTVKASLPGPRMCHSVFDKGLVKPSSGYEIPTSRELTTLNNLPGCLTNPEGRSIVGSSQEPFWPDVGSLRWHRENVFRAG